MYVYVIMLATEVNNIKVSKYIYALAAINKNKC